MYAIRSYYLQFYENLPRMFPNNPNAKAAFAGEEKKAHVQTTALRNGSLQGAYLILAARALGLDCGPMSGFDNAKVDAAFFPEGRMKSNFLCNRITSYNVCYTKLLRDLQRPSGKNAASTLALSNPDIGPQSSPSARAARIR